MNASSKFFKMSVFVVIVVLTLAATSPAMAGGPLPEPTPTPTTSCVEHGNSGKCDQGNNQNSNHQNQPVHDSGSGSSTYTFSDGAVQNSTYEWTNSYSYEQNGPHFQNSWKSDYVTTYPDGNQIMGYADSRNNALLDANWQIKLSNVSGSGCYGDSCYRYHTVVVDGQTKVYLYWNNGHLVK